jgi:hypothetical protein
MGLLDKVKDVAGKAAEQAKHATEVGKEKLEDRKLTKQVETLLAEIGEIVVAQRRGTAAPDAEAQITAKIAEITDLEQQIEANNVAAEAAAGGTAGAGTTDSATTETPPAS